MPVLYRKGRKVLPFLHLEKSEPAKVVRVAFGFENRLA